MIIYGHHINNEGEPHSFSDNFFSETNYVKLSFFGYEEELYVNGDSHLSLNDTLKIDVMMDRFVIENTSETETFRMMISDGNLGSINNFEVINGNAEYAHPSMLELTDLWFITIEPLSKIEFYYVTHTGTINPDYRCNYSYPICYDPISQKEFILHSDSFKNDQEQYLTVTGFIYSDTEITLTEDDLDGKLWYINGIQSITIPKGRSRLNIFIAPTKTIDLSKVVYIPHNCIVEFPLTTLSSNVPSDNVLYRVTLPSKYDFIKINIHEEEMKSLRYGYSVYFKSTYKFVYDTDTYDPLTQANSINIENERPSKILTNGDIVEADYIIDLVYDIPYNSISIHGNDLVLNAVNKILGIDTINDEVTISLDLSTFISLPLPGEYMTINGITENNIYINDEIYVITSIDTTNLEQTIIKGVKV